MANYRVFAEEQFNHDNVDSLYNVQVQMILCNVLGVKVGC